MHVRIKWKRKNSTCKELFDRLVAKGKNKKPAVKAVANKLLKQVFGVVKNECLFDRNYYKKIACIIFFYAQFRLVAVFCQGSLFDLIDNFNMQKLVCKN